MQDLDAITKRVPDEILPEITATQSWCCENGCGETQPTRVDFDYWTATDADTGELLYRVSGGVYASKCCEAKLELWDEAVGDCIEWEPTNLDEIDRARKS